ncbi:hypothetical protein [Pajaroellobacter abortibovis]|uniref:NodB homology domain-containing protein n=1 Tax=Pajaroellobacter abortibovis TaxID=1882918 RepID=A0A1L6MX31_9BACT|nr:hypothetical protein [Pajaroellobacter abortibovis]APS00111.1 hypothetical protein BCY86_05010 [Pajaroellobacter abortibovis]
MVLVSSGSLSSRSCSLFLCISIDCECDKGLRWQVQKPISFRGIWEGIQSSLQPLFEHYRAKPTYLLSPEVIQDEQSAEMLMSLGKRAELGTHLHGEWLDPNAFEPNETDTLQCEYTPEEEYLKLEGLTSLFSSTFSYRPTSFRAGRFGIGKHSLGFLERLGYMVDSSVTPFLDWSSIGGRTFKNAPTQPYYPSYQSPDHALLAPQGEASILEVPVTILPHPLMHIPWLGSILESRLRARWLRPTWSSIRGLAHLAQDVIRRNQTLVPLRPIVLNAMFHNVEVVPGASPYAQNKREAKAVLRRLEELIRFASYQQIPMIGLTDVRELWR